MDSSSHLNVTEPKSSLTEDKYICIPYFNSKAPCTVFQKSKMIITIVNTPHIPF